MKINPRRDIMVHFEALMVLVLLKPAGCNDNEVFFRRLLFQVTVGCGPFDRNRIGQH
jgi:hypothetical protein